MPLDLLHYPVQCLLVSLVLPFVPVGLHTVLGVLSPLLGGVMGEALPLLSLFRFWSLAMVKVSYAILRRPSATCTDVCGNETAYRSGFCVLLHLSKGVAGFALFLNVVVKRAAPLVALTPTFPLHRELLRENDPEMKRKFCKVSSGNRTTSDPS